MNTIVKEDNHKDVEKLIQFFTKKGIEIHLDTIIDCGRAKTLNNIGSIEYNLDFIQRVMIDNNHVLDVNNITRNVCGVGEKLVYLDYLGYFNLCTGLNRELNPSFNLGRNMQKAINKIKNFDLSCSNKSCKFSKNDSCGCRHRAYIHHKLINAKDDIICSFVNRQNMEE